jgi:cyanophycinase
VSGRDHDALVVAPYDRVMTGTLVLQGGGPFVANDELDREVLAGIERIVMLPTADAFERPEDMVAAAEAWGERIGIEVEPLMVLTRPQADAAAAAVVDGAPAVFLAGDSSNHLRSVMKDTPLFAAVERVLEHGGTVVAAASSASALCDPMTDRRGGAFALGLGMVAGLAVVTETEIWPADQLERARGLADTPLVELPTGSALIRRDGAWRSVGDVVVHGDLPG